MAAPRGAVEDFKAGWRESPTVDLTRSIPLRILGAVAVPLVLGCLLVQGSSLLPRWRAPDLFVFVALLVPTTILQLAIHRPGSVDQPTTRKFVLKVATLSITLTIALIAVARGIPPTIAAGVIATSLASMAPYAKQGAFGVWGLTMGLVAGVPVWIGTSVTVLSGGPATGSQASDDAVRLLAVSGLFAAVGALARRDAAEQAKVASALEAERTRIARELHDIVAHQMTVVVLQAEGARAVLAEDPARAERALSTIESTTRDALVELRRMLGVLRDGGPSDGAPTETVDVARSAPQPTLASLPSLFAQMGDGELRIEAAMEVPDDLSPGTELQAYRIVQEALTNVRRHAGAARADVTIASAGPVLEIRVDDDGEGNGRAAVGGSGLGLQGMRERVELLGGELEAGPRAGGGWSVVARLPLDATEVR